MKKILVVISLLTLLSTTCAYAAKNVSSKDVPKSYEEVEEIMTNMFDYRKHYPVDYVNSLATCAKYQKLIDFKTFIKQQKINGFQDGFCSTTDIFYDTDKNPQTMLECQYPKSEMSKIIMSFEALHSGTMVKVLDKEPYFLIDGARYPDYTRKYCTVTNIN